MSEDGAMTVFAENSSDYKNKILKIDKSGKADCTCRSMRKQIWTERL